MINCILIVIGIILGIYGFKTRMKFFMIVGIVIFCMGVISAVLDCAMIQNGADTHRVPFLIDKFM